MPASKTVSLRTVIGGDLCEAEAPTEAAAETDRKVHGGAAAGNALGVPPQSIYDARK